MAGETVTLALIFGKHRAAYTLPAEVTATDATAATMVEGYLRAYGLWRDGQTNAQRLTAFVRHLAQHVRDAGESVAVRDAVEARRAELKAERANLKWRD